MNALYLVIGIAITFVIVLAFITFDGVWIAS